MGRMSQLQLASTSAVALPARQIWDQGHEINCCTSCALATCLEARYPHYPVLSVLFHFYISRPFGSGPTPITLSSAFVGALRSGICYMPLHDFPITFEGALRPPSSEAISDAAGRKLGPDPFTGGSLCRMLPSFDRERSWKRALLQRYPILLGFFPDDAYWRMKNGGANRWTPTGIGEEVGHAVAILGFRDDQSAFVVQDSRGMTFAQGGQWWLPYEVIQTSLIYAAYAIGKPALEPW